MSRSLARAITACLSVSSSPLEHASELANFGRSDWERGLEWLDSTGLAPWFWDRLKASGARDAVPLETAARLDRNFGDHRLRVAAMAEEFEIINRSLQLASVDYAVLKGFALIPEYAPDARLRVAYDYDYLVESRSMERVAQALRKAGYIRRQERVDHPVVYVQSAHAPQRPSQRDDLYSANLHRSIEIHTRLWEPEVLKIGLPMPEDFLARSRPRTWQGLRFCSLSEEDELLFQVLHAFRHIIECWCRLCSFLEIAYFMERRRTDSAFWQRFSERIQISPLLQEMVGVVFSLSADLFGATLPGNIEADIIRAMRYPLHLWVNRYGYQSALGNFTGNKYSLLLHREFVPDAAAWREIRRSRLFPLHRPSRAASRTTTSIPARLTAGWKQSAYVARRLWHHSKAAALYAWESIQWGRIRIARR